jgi:uncharacterized protein YcbX
VISAPSGIALTHAPELVTRTFQDHVTISWGGMALDRHARVVDAAGRTVAEFQPDMAQAVIQTDHLAPGIYLVSLDLDGNLLNARFAVARH